MCHMCTSTLSEGFDGKIIGLADVPPASGEGVIWFCMSCGTPPHPRSCCALSVVATPKILLPGERKQSRLRVRFWCSSFPFVLRFVRTSLIPFSYRRRGGLFFVPCVILRKSTRWKDNLLYRYPYPGDTYPGERHKNPRQTPPVDTPLSL